MSLDPIERARELLRDPDDDTAAELLASADRVRARLDTSLGAMLTRAQPTSTPSRTRRRP